ncbi:hypothetical protein BBJ28_00009267 [Nothophytophthora sp. Chile5]|nr:hypothetical protein BBJ28_00009267 [Nothophytophthora sp. Chile5]
MIKVLPELRVLSLRAVLPNYPAQGELWRQIFTFAKAHDVVITGPSFAINHTKDGKQSEVDVEVCLPIATNIQVSEEPPLLVRDLPAVPRAATAIHIGSYDGLCNVYPKLFAWIATEGLSPAGPSREVYVQRSSGNGTDDQPNLTEIQLPLA